MSADDRELQKMLDDLTDDVPPMPEHLHDQWMEAIRMTPQEHQTQKNGTGTTKRTFPWVKVIGIAAAAVFALTGAIYASREVPPAATNTAARRNDTENSYTTGFSAPKAVSGAMYSEDAAPAAWDGGAYEEAEYDSVSSANADTGVAMDADAPAVYDRKLIRSISVTIYSSSFESTHAAVRAACEAAGGYISWSSENSSGTPRRVSMTLRIPADRTNTFLDDATAGEGCRVTRREETVEDVTESYYDTASRLTSQQALLDRLVSLTTDAASLTELLELEAEIADTQNRIDRLQASLNHTDDQVAYSTVSLTLYEEVPEKKAADPQMTFGQRLLAGLKAGFGTFGGFLQQTAVFLAAMLPFAAAAAVIGLIVRAVIRHRKAGRVSEKEEKEEGTEE